MKQEKKTSPRRPRVTDLEKVEDQKSDQVRGGALNAYISSKVKFEKQGSGSS